MSKSIEEYLSLCTLHHVSPLSSICITLKHPSLSSFYISDIISSSQIIHLLFLEKLFISYKKFENIKKLNFNGSKVGDLGCVCLGNIIAKSKVIEEIDLSHNGIGNEGVNELAKAMEINKSVKIMNLKGNNIGTKGCEVLGKKLSKNHSLEYLDVSNCDCGSRGIKELKCVAKVRKDNLNLLKDNVEILSNFFIEGEESNYKLEEILSSISHGMFVFIFIIPASILLFKKADSNIMLFSYITYMGSLMLMYVSSCLLHALFSLHKQVLNIFKLLDHCSICILIAGTYSPLLLNSFGHLKIGLFFFFLIWFLAVLTIFVIMLEEYWKLELFLYLSMGYVSILLFPNCWNLLSIYGWILIMAGGLCFTFGVIFYVIGRSKPIYHVYWHFCVFLGTFFHYLAIYYYDYPHERNIIYSLVENIFAGLIY